MTQEKARDVMVSELAQHIEKWVNHKSEDEGDWHDAGIGYVHEGVEIDMAKAALLILFALSDAQKYAVDEGFLNNA